MNIRSGYLEFNSGLLYDAMYYGEVLGLSDEIMKICERMSEDDKKAGIHEILCDDKMILEVAI